ncbi:MAG: hypothetical protein EP298_04495 [Gammaproteobacteria bacterium]|nr:MAG: hypothetical protein EP298_04495 [Gammaproteobacteria bacterium]UTW41670.1 hypothetical protein KFE69_09145 [bacterium SCSIO 12844]
MKHKDIQLKFNRLLQCIEYLSKMDISKQYAELMRIRYLKYESSDDLSIKEKFINSEEVNDFLDIFKKFQPINTPVDDVRLKSKKEEEKEEEEDDAELKGVFESNFGLINAEIKINWQDEGTKIKEWSKAKKYFRENSGEFKLKHERGSSKVNPKNKDNHKSHSFLNIEGKILAVNTKALGSGGNGQVTLAEDEDGKLYAIKRLKNYKFANEEAQTSKNLGASIGDHKRKDSNKHYIAYEYLGESLKSYLKREKDNLSEIQQLDLAIQLFKLIDKMHSGRASKTGEKIAHLDIKPDNIVIDKNGNLHLVDYGLSKNLDSKGSVGGTPAFLPSNHRSETREHLDIYAALRVLGFVKTNVAIWTKEDCGLTYQFQMVSKNRQDLNKQVWIFNDKLIDNNSKINNLIKIASQKTLNKNITAKQVNEQLKEIKSELEKELIGEYQLKKLSHAVEYKFKKLQQSVAREYIESAGLDVEENFPKIKDHLNQFNVICNILQIDKGEPKINHGRLKKVIDNIEKIDSTIKKLNIKGVDFSFYLPSVIDNIENFINVVDFLYTKNLDINKYLPKALDNFEQFQTTIGNLDKCFGVALFPRYGEFLDRVEEKEMVNFNKACQIITDAQLSLHGRILFDGHVCSNIIEGYEKLKQLDISSNKCVEVLVRHADRCNLNYLEKLHQLYKTIENDNFPVKGLMGGNKIKTTSSEKTVPEGISIIWNKLADKSGVFKADVIANASQILRECRSEAEKRQGSSNALVIFMDIRDPNTKQAYRDIACDLAHS